MQKNSVYLFALVALLAIAVGSVSAFDPMSELFDAEHVVESMRVVREADFDLQPIVATAESCDKCTDFIGTLMFDLYDNATLSEIEETLKLACFLVPLDQQKQCRAHITSLVQSLKSTDKNLIEDYTAYQFCGALSLCPTACCLTPYWPEGIHISLTDDPSSIWIIWYVSHALRQ